jgi:hypothetical protein
LTINKEINRRRRLLTLTPEGYRCFTEKHHLKNVDIAVKVVADIAWI